VCARRHSDDDREQPRGLADQLARLDTERGWMRTNPPAGDPASEHVDPPESTPAHYSPRLPAPPPVPDSWDAVLSSGPQPSRSADPWATSPATPDDPEQELWTPPQDTVYRPSHTGSSGGNSLPERWPSQAGASASSRPVDTGPPAADPWSTGDSTPPGWPGSPDSSRPGDDPLGSTASAATDGIESADRPAAADRDADPGGGIPAGDSAPGGDRGPGASGRDEAEGWSWGTEPASGDTVSTGPYGGEEREAAAGGWSSSDTGSISWTTPPAAEKPGPVGWTEDEAEPGSGLLSDTDENDWPEAEPASWSGSGSSPARWEASAGGGAEPWSVGEDRRTDSWPAVEREESAGSSSVDPLGSGTPGSESAGWSGASTRGEVSSPGPGPETPEEPGVGAWPSPDDGNAPSAVGTGWDSDPAPWSEPDRTAPPEPATPTSDLSDDEWLAHLRGAGPDEEEARPEWAWQRFGGRRDERPSWSAPDEPAVEPAPAEQPTSLPPPSVSPQWTMGPASEAHPVAARSADQPPPAGHRFGPVLSAGGVGITDLPPAPAGPAGMPARTGPVPTGRPGADTGPPSAPTGLPAPGVPTSSTGWSARRLGSSDANDGRPPLRIGPPASDPGAWPAPAGIDNATELLPPPSIPPGDSDTAHRGASGAGWQTGAQAMPAHARRDDDARDSDAVSGGWASAEPGASGDHAAAVFPPGAAGLGTDDARDEAYGDRSYGQQVILGGHGDRSTGALPAVGEDVRMPGERTGVADANDVTREWVAPTEDDATLVEPGPGQFSLPLPETPNEDSSAEEAPAAHGSADGGSAESVDHSDSAGDADAPHSWAPPSEPASFGAGPVDTGSVPMAGLEESGPAGGAYGAVTGTDAGSGDSDDAGGSALYGPPAGPSADGGVAAGYASGPYGFPATGPQREPGDQAASGPPAGQGGPGVPGAAASYGGASAYGAPEGLGNSGAPGDPGPYGGRGAQGGPGTQAGPGLQGGPGGQGAPELRGGPGLQGGAGVQGQYGGRGPRGAGPQGPPSGLQGPPPGMFGAGMQGPQGAGPRDVGPHGSGPYGSGPQGLAPQGVGPQGAGPQGAADLHGSGSESAGPYGARPQGAHPQSGGPQGVPPTVEQLTAQSLLRQRRPTPQTGWRRAVYNISAHTVNPGQSNDDRRRQELIARASVPVPGCYRIAVISLKGGVGKTTTTVTLGATLASLRGDRVIAVDANPDRGTLSGKIPLETVATVRNLLNDVDSIQHYFDVRRYTSQSADRLEVLASESDPAVSTAFSEADYRTVAAVLERFYNIVLTDCGTGLLHSAMAGVLDLADQIVLVSSGSVDGARSASATLDWLEAHGRSELVRNSVAVINSVRPKSGGVDLDRLEEHFAARCRAVTRIPYDPHLEEGAEVDLGELSGASRSALLELAAAVADAFPRRSEP
jgi:MinD-like ATPase involved in chromosome partitioning or flagellar assembly